VIAAPPGAVMLGPRVLGLSSRALPDPTARQQTPAPSRLADGWHYLPPLGEERGVSFRD